MTELLTLNVRNSLMSSLAVFMNDIATFVGEGQVVRHLILERQSAHGTPGSSVPANKLSPSNRVVQ